VSRPVQHLASRPARRSAPERSPAVRCVGVLSRLRRREAVNRQAVLPSARVGSEAVLAAEPVAERPAQHWVQLEASARQARAPLPAEPVASDALEPPREAARAAVAPQAVRRAAEAVRPAERAGGRPEVAAVWAAAARRREARDAAGVQRRAEPGAPVAALPSVGLPSGVAWAFRRDRVLPWPEPRPAARFARAMVR
jgi:hypothetical protein